MVNVEEMIYSRYAARREAAIIKKILQVARRGHVSRNSAWVTLVFAIQCVVSALR